MTTGILHLHVTVVVVFILLFTLKVALLLLNKTVTLELLRTRTKITEMVLGIFILATEGYLLFSLPTIAGYLIGKIIIVLVAIPLGIIGLKKNNKALAVISWLAFLYVYGVAETDSLKFKKDKFELPVSAAENSEDTGHTILNENKEVALQNAARIYTSLCSPCHGKDGKLGIGGAKDLTQSKLTEAEKIRIIKEGKGVMPKFADQLSDQEIESVVKYLETL